MVVPGTVSIPGIVVATVGGYISADTELDLRSYARVEWLLICDIDGYVWWPDMVSAPKERDRGGGAGYDDQAMSSLDGSLPTDVDHGAEGGGACGVYGENAGVIGESPGYDLQVAFISPGLDELGLVSADIQLVMPCCP
jgi:hypothetical protein